MKIKLMPLLAGVITLSAVATPFIVNAQTNTNDQPAPAQTTRQRQGKWDKLNLSDQQKEQLRQIHEETRTQMEAILTPQQLEQLKTAKQNRQARQPGQARQSDQARQPGQARQAGKWGFMTALNLSTEQEAKIKEIMAAKKSRIQAVFTPEQQQQLQQLRQQRQQQRQQRQQQQNNQ